jgi:hypothetical protein
MGNKFRVEVRESCEELQHRLRHAANGATKERVQMLALAQNESERYQTRTVTKIRKKRINRVSLAKKVSTKGNRSLAVRENASWKTKFSSTISARPTTSKVDST